MFTSLIISLVLALGIGTTATANSAKPGDLLFGWDQAAERIRLALTFGDEARATYQAEVAEERVDEQFRLEARGSDHVDESEAAASRALDQALAAVNRVNIELREKKGAGSQSLERVEVRLRTLRDEHTNASERLQVEAETKDGRTVVHVESGRNTWEFTTSETSTDGIVAALVATTGLPEADIRAALVVRNDDEQEDDDSRNTNSGTNTNRTNTNSGSNRNVNAVTNTNRNNNENDDKGGDRNANVNANANTNSSVNTNTVIRSDDSASSSEIRVRVNASDGKTEIRTVVNGQEQEWEVATTSQTEILVSISTRTGLTNAQITGVWEYEAK